MAICFVDSTTLLYPLDPGEPEKAERCEAWLNPLRLSLQMTLTVQVLNESYWVVKRKAAFAAARSSIRGYLMRHRRWATAPLDSATLVGAWAIQDRYGVRFWDALLLSSANAARCSYFLSENLSDGQAYGQVVAVDPFRHAPEDVLGRAP